MVTAQAEADPQGTRTIPLAGMTATLTNIAYVGLFCKWVRQTILALFPPRDWLQGLVRLLAAICGLASAAMPAPGIRRSINRLRT